MQQPPPGPPEGPMEPPPPVTPPPAPPPSASSPMAGTSTGMSRQSGSLIAYALWWVTGLVMLFVGKDDPEIKFNAAQSIIFFGGYSIIEYVLGFLAPGSAFMALIRGVLGLYVFISWIVLLIRTHQADGNRVEVPLLGSVVAPFAEQLAAAVT